ncbi:alpha/beta hydrolase [Pseudonocardia sp. KRD-182]|uniref:alpha/beta hydrolase n=1 Tax=Pseudonocardia oceani TaxID=2792013 RepID=UPI001C49EDDC|nr:alpha/beta fold hydrolase [Pseudonocardia oceani]MBW0113332.1 alpha/beta hydrolase [Pseudonocardia oceani]
MRRTPLIAAVCAVAATVLAAVPAVASASPSKSDVVELPISFQVANTNRTAVPCASDGAEHTVRGTLVAPREALESGDAAMLYLHAVTWGEYYWRFQEVPGYDAAHQLAEQGHVSVTIDRLGYGDSDRPAGYGTCIGSEADVAGQMVDALRSGDYALDGAEPAAFDDVFLAGSSVGALIAHTTAYTFGNVDGVVNMSWGDFAVSPFTGAALTDVLARCALGGDPGADPGYAAIFRGQQDEFYFSSAAPDVRDAVPALNPDPCGQLASIPAAVAADVVGLGLIDVPVLVVFGDADSVFLPPAAAQQSLRYLGSPEVSTVTIADASHFPLVEANHLDAVAALDEWLDRNGG